MRRYLGRLLLGLVFIILSNVLAVYSPQIIRNAIDHITHLSAYAVYFTEPHTAVSLRGLMGQHITYFAGAVLLIAILRGVFMFFMRQTIIVMSRLVEYDQKNELFAHYQNLDIEYLKQHSTGDLMARITEDVSRVRMYTGPALMYTFNLITLFVLVVAAMLHVSVELTLYSVLPLPILGFAIYYVNGIIQRRSEEIQQQLARLTTHAQEAFAGIRVIKAFGKELVMTERFEAQGKLYREKSLALGRVEATYFPLITLLVGISTLLTVVAGGLLVQQGKVTTGNIAEFVIYVNLLTWPFAAVGWVSALVQRAAASQKRINELLAEQPTIRNDGHVQVPIQGGIEFQRVSFTYPHSGIEALRNISFTIKPGEKVAILGPTGSGKSTLVHLLIRLYDPDKGQIRIDGIPLQYYELSSLRNQIAIVPQDVFLFSDTLQNNITFAPRWKGTAADVVQVAQHVALWPEIERMPAQLQTIIGERGVLLSGGQRQRVAMARALLAGGRIFVFDDSFSSVDAQTELSIQKYLATALKNHTVLVITHRILTSMHFDQILVLSGGQLVEAGNHYQLLSRNGYYAMLCRLQQAEETTWAL